MQKGILITYFLQSNREWGQWLQKGKQQQGREVGIKLLQCLKGTGGTFKVPYDWVGQLSFIQSNIIIS